MRCSSSPGSVPSRSRRSRRYRSKRSSATAGPRTSASLRSRSASSGSSCGDSACAASSTGSASACAPVRLEARARTTRAAAASAAAARRISASGPYSSSPTPDRPPASASASRASRAASAASRSSAAAASRTRPDSLAAVDLARRGSQPVSDTVAHDRVRAAGGARPRHQHLQALQPIARRLVAPDELDQLLGPHRAAVTRRESGEQRLRAVARDRSPPPAHIFQQGQGDAHRFSLEAPGSADGLRRGATPDRPG